MSSLTGRSRNGQVLVQVAMLMVVLLALMAIAIDMGHIYNERRVMQNAADAGALAGAWEICFGDPALAEQTAWDYAVNRNGAQTADVSIAGGEVTVYAREDAGLYLARIFGANTTEVNAMAVATCGGAISLCNVWPISFRWERWKHIECEEEFYVFNDGRFEEDDPCYWTDEDGLCHPMCDKVYDDDPEQLPGYCECDMIPPDNHIFRVGPGDRGWLLFPRPSPPYDSFDPGCADNCGDQVRCWIDSGSYTGQVPLPAEVGGICLPGQPGVDESVRIEIERDHLPQPPLFEPERPNVLIWDDTCDPGDPNKVGTCPGNLYHITTTGCIELLDVIEYDLLVKPDFRRDPEKEEKCVPNVKVIEVRKDCGDCNSECGSTDGEPGGLGVVRSVALIK
jgi:hypothetical protein